MMWQATILGVPLLGRDYCNHGYHSLLRCCNRGHFIDKVHQSRLQDNNNTLYIPNTQETDFFDASCYLSSSGNFLATIAALCNNMFFAYVRGGGSYFLYILFVKSKRCSHGLQNDDDVLTILSGYVASRIEYSSCVSRHKPKLNGRRSN